MQTQDKVTDRQLSDEQSREIAETIREELARRRISRQALAEQAKLSLSTLEKVLGGRRPFTLATTVRLEQALGVQLLERSSRSVRLTAAGKVFYEDSSAVLALAARAVETARRTASGERFDMGAFTAAHRTLPFGSKVRVTNPANGKSVVVRINDRGPFTKGRAIDVSRAAAERLGLIARGHGRVELALID